MLTGLILAAALAGSGVGRTAKPTLTRQLQTAHYRVTIREFCTEPIECRYVDYTAVSTSGKAIELQGAHLWHTCLGTNDPCHPIGYEFKNKGVSYMVTEEGRLVVTQGLKTLVDEPGTWTDE